MQNPFETACREWLKGCSCCEQGQPEQCQECTEAFLTAMKDLAVKQEPLGREFEQVLNDNLWELMVRT